MKTTLDLDDDLREKLLHLAAQHQDEDLSRIINRAIRQYVEDLEANQQEERLQRIRALWGSISDEDADHMRAVVKDLRENWR